MLDLIIKGGLVVDGTGTEPYSADVGVEGGRIAAIGRITADAARTVDAAGQVVSPGFIDIHTHYDAQLSWDASASPSPLHGVTTVIAGNCGFTIAPLEASEAEYLLHMLGRVEGIPVAALKAGLDWDWRSFGEWMGRFEGNLGPNAGFLVGHSTLRRVVMGSESNGVASPEQIARMERLLEDALSSGAMGFSSSRSPTHLDGDRNPVPSRAASDDELIRLAAATGRHPGTQLEYIPTAGRFGNEHVAMMTALSRAADRPINWNTLRVESDDRAHADHQLASYDQAAAAGACVLALTYPDVTKRRLFMSTGVGLGHVPGWSDVMGMSLEERRRALSDPAVRKQMRAGAASVPDNDPFIGIARYQRYVFAETFAPENEGVRGRLVDEVAQERGLDPLDVLLDVVLADGLLTGLDLSPVADDDDCWKLRAEFARDHRTIVGASDAGAHLDMMCGSVYTTTVLRTMVRDRGLLSLEEAVHLLTEKPARLYGLRGRGRIAEGYAADLVIFDPATVGPRELQTVQDLPGNAARQYAASDGIDRVFVNGTELVSGGELTEARPGTLLRSTTDLDTVTVADALALGVAERDRVARTSRGR